jgi:hypothetical protein
MAVPGRSTRGLKLALLLWTITGKCLFEYTVEGEMGVAGFLVNFFKDCGVDLWLVWLAGYACSGEVQSLAKSASTVWVGVLARLTLTPYLFPRGRSHTVLYRPVVEACLPRPRESTVQEMA